MAIVEYIFESTGQSMDINEAPGMESSGFLLWSHQGEVPLCK